MKVLGKNIKIDLDLGFVLFPFFLFLFLSYLIPWKNAKSRWIEYLDYQGPKLDALGHA